MKKPEITPCPITGCEGILGQEVPDYANEQGTYQQCDTCGYEDRVRPKITE